jgi:hypothetical protein
MMKLLSFLLVIMILVSGFSKPGGAYIKTNTGKMCSIKHQPNKPGCCTKANKTEKSGKGNQHTGGSFCYYCILCIAFIVTPKTGIQRNFAFTSANYPDLLQSEPSDYNPACWKPPAA